MRRIVVIAAVAAVLAATWVSAGRIPIRLSSDVDVHQTVYAKSCDPIASAYFRGNGHVRLSIDRYKEMVARLQACNARATPAIAKR